MSVDIQFFTPNGEPLSLDVETGGVDFGVVKKGQQYIIPVMVKNLGDSNAKNLMIYGSPLHTPAQIPLEDYNLEVLASQWKTFSYFPDKEFINTLYLPDIQAGKTMVGKKEIVETYTNPANSSWINDTFAGHIFRWTGNSLVCTRDASDSFTARVDGSGWGQNKEIDFTVEFSMPSTLTAGSAFVMFNLRQNCLGDDKGYLINVKRNATAGTVFFEIRKGTGLRQDNKTDYGTVIVSSGTAIWQDFAPLRIKVFTNQNNLPEIKLWYKNIKDTDIPLLWGSNQSWVDTANTYPYAGGVSATLGTVIGGIFELQRATILTDDTEGKFYIRTVVGNGAEDSKLYRSSVELSYDSE